MPSLINQFHIAMQGISIFMPKNKKSEMSIGLIVAAVTGLIILVVVIVMIGGKFGAFGKGANEQSNIAKACSEQGGNVETGAACSSGSKIFASDTIAFGKICCKSGAAPAPPPSACAGEGESCGATACCLGL